MTKKENILLFISYGIFMSLIRILCSSFFIESFDRILRKLKIVCIDGLETHCKASKKEVISCLHIRISIRVLLHFFLLVLFVRVSLSLIFFSFFSVVLSADKSI